MLKDADILLKNVKEELIEMSVAAEELGIDFIFKNINPILDDIDRLEFNENDTLDDKFKICSKINIRMKDLVKYFHVVGMHNVSEKLKPISNECLMFYRLFKDMLTEITKIKKGEVK